MSFLGSKNSKLALIIGINHYTGMQGELNGCINDTKKIINFKNRCGYLDRNIILLTDDTAQKLTVKVQNIINHY